MVIKDSHQALLNQLKEKVKQLTEKETRAKAELRTALSTMRGMASAYKKTLTSKMQSMQEKLEEAKAHGYVKAAIEMEQLLLKGVEKNARAVASAAARMRKKVSSKRTSPKKAAKTTKRAKKKKARH